MSVEELSKQRQDPVAGIKSIYFQDVILSIGEGTAHSFSIQPVFPIRIAENLKIISYTIIPIQYVPPLAPGLGSSFGLGNILINGYFSSIQKKGKFSWGVGPSIQLPTRTNESLGSNRVSIGPSALVYYAGDKFSGGAVVQNYWSLGGTGINKVNLFSCQYIAYYNLPEGWFLESNTTAQANWLADQGQEWFIPVGGGGGKTFKIGDGKLFYCATAQFFYNAVKPDIVGDWEAVLQFQIIF
ncbi:hypothetical protein [Galbibacter pacificus]|uniref:Neuromedin U n=1 Tax=Galbibacter pacificus TaxID=2996052 RepID=A0ABT6FS06_9FLAO|nr:hypothetical protein [Galbibacter pacificus]MDG3582829.1 hypothetical protein [Galbibacter pacificus]MDG3586052.1 hypothetical protein [Galbibacter pacificus]